MTDIESSSEQLGFRPRSPLQVILSVWKALFLREALSRLFASRTSMLWLFFEPVFQMSYMLVIFTVVRVHVVAGLDTMVWLLSGALAFLIFRRTATQASIAVDANQSLFTYRQVKPVDVLFIRACLELFIIVIVASILFSGISLLGHDVIPYDPLSVMVAAFGMWICGLGWGLISSVGQRLIPELANISHMIMMPLYFISGTIFPVGKVPQPYLDWLLLNPLVHGLEGVRQGFSPYYHEIPGTSLGYLYCVAVAMLFIGLALHRHFAAKLTAR